MSSAMMTIRPLFKIDVANGAVYLMDATELASFLNTNKIPDTCPNLTSQENMHGKEMRIFETIQFK